MPVETDLITRLERYYDAVPRPRATVEEIGPFTLFVATTGWPYYARPRLGEAAEITVDDIRRVLARQRALEAPQSLEWVDDVTPGLLEVAEAAGMTVARCPLLVLDGEPQGSAGTARMLHVNEDDQIRLSRAAVSIGFGHGGTAIGEPGIVERDALVAVKFATVDESLRQRMVDGQFRSAGVFVESAPELGPVGGGGYSPVAVVAEITGVAVLPAFRRQGLGAQLLYVLSCDALEHGVTTVFCSAESVDVARVYEGVGFRRVGTACIAEA